MRDFLRLMAPTLKAVKERHDDPKNASKGAYPSDIYEAWSLTNKEFAEATDELLALFQATTYDDTLKVLERLRYELADVILCASMALAVVEKKLQEPEHEN